MLRLVDSGYRLTVGIEREQRCCFTASCHGLGHCSHAAQPGTWHGISWIIFPGDRNWVMHPKRIPAGFPFCPRPDRPKAGRFARAPKPARPLNRPVPKFPREFDVDGGIPRRMATRQLDFTGGRANGSVNDFCRS